MTATSNSQGGANPTMLEQMGGLGGIVASALPVLAFVPINSRMGLRPALLAALGIAVLILIWRLARKENIQPAISGFFGVAVCAGIAWYMGEAKGYFLYGIWYSLVTGIIFTISIPLRWPLVGVIWHGINGHGQRWRSNRRAVTLYSIATAAWALVFFARFGVQQWLYGQEGETATTILGYTRLAMGLPLTAILVLITIWAVRGAEKAEHAGADATPEVRTEGASDDRG